MYKSIINKGDLGQNRAGSTDAVKKSSTVLMSDIGNHRGDTLRRHSRHPMSCDRFPSIDPNRVIR